MMRSKVFSTNFEMLEMCKKLSFTCDIFPFETKTKEKLEKEIVTNYANLDQTSKLRHCYRFYCLNLMNY